MRAARVKAMATLAVLVCASLAGCLSTVDNGEDENPITMAVHYESTSGTILERVQNGATLSQTGVELAFVLCQCHLKSRSDDDFHARSR